MLLNRRCIYSLGSLLGWLEVHGFRAVNVLDRFSGNRGWKIGCSGGDILNRHGLVYAVEWHCLAVINLLTRLLALGRRMHTVREVRARHARVRLHLLLRLLLILTL